MLEDSLAMTETHEAGSARAVDQKHGGGPQGHVWVEAPSAPRTAGPPTVQGSCTTLAHDAATPYVYTTESQVTNPSQRCLIDRARQSSSTASQPTHGDRLSSQYIMSSAPYIDARKDASTSNAVTDQQQVSHPHSHHHQSVNQSFSNSYVHTTNHAQS